LLGTASHVIHRGDTANDAAEREPVYAPRDEPWGMHSSMIADPEGNLIEIGSWNLGLTHGRHHELI
jgi:hypothetical protein